VIHADKGTFVRISADTLQGTALSVTALEQVLGSCRKGLGAEHLEAEGVGEPVGRVERGADRKRILDLLG